MIADLTEQKLHELELKAVTIRELIIKALTEAGSGHTGGSLGMADIFTAFYFHILNHNPKNPEWPERDILILSNGHICPARYATMALAGYFPVEELKTMRKINSRLQGHPERLVLPGVETSSGPLGEGISQSIGVALASKMQGSDRKIYCLTSDGEHQEGNTWEALMFASKYKIDNLCVVIDRNNIQIDGYTEDVMPLENLKAKYEAFNWQVFDADAHDIKMFVDTVREASTIHQKPSVIIAHTIPGKGVDFMENRYQWHGVPPDSTDVTGAPPKGQQEKEALRQLEEARLRLTRNA